MGERCDIFITENSPSGGLVEVQFQIATFTFTLTAADLSFAQRIVDFVAETKGNPAYRDQHLGGGRYGRTSEKSIDLSSSFPGSNFQLEKDGEFDDSYVVRVSSPSGLRLQFDIRGDLLESLVERLRELI